MSIEDRFSNSVSELLDIAEKILENEGLNCGCESTNMCRGQATRLLQGFRFAVDGADKILPGVVDRDVGLGWLLGGQKLFSSTGKFEERAILFTCLHTIPPHLLTTPGQVDLWSLKGAKEALSS